MAIIANRLFSTVAALTISVALFSVVLI